MKSSNSKSESSQKSLHPTKSLSNNHLYFNKISLSLTKEIVSFLTLPEQVLSISSWSKSFKSVFITFQIPLEHQSKLNYSQYIKYLNFCLDWQNKSPNYSPHLNNIMNVNISNHAKGLSQELAVVSYLKYRYANTQNSKYLLILSNVNQIASNSFIITSLPFYREWKYCLYLTDIASIKDQEQLDQIKTKLIDLLTLFPIHKEYPSKFNSLKIIQREIMEKQIECFFNKVTFNGEQDLSLAWKYFKKYPNHWASITNEEQIPLLQHNLTSVTTIKTIGVNSLVNAPSWQNLEKIKYEPEREISSPDLANKGFNISNLKTFGGVWCQTKEDVDLLIQQTNEMKVLKKLDFIGYCYDPAPNWLFLYYLNNLPANPSINSIKLWGNFLNLPHDINVLINKFPNLHCIIEDFDCSDIGSVPCEIPKIFAHILEEDFLSEDVLRWIIKWMENYISYKKEGKKYISFNLLDQTRILYALFKWLEGHKVLDHIYTIDNQSFYDCNDTDSLINLKKMMFFEWTEDNMRILFWLDNIECIAQVQIKEKKLLIDNINFIVKKKPVSVVYLGVVDDEVSEWIKTVETIRYWIIKETEEYKSTNVNVLKVTETEEDFYLMRFQL